MSLRHLPNLWRTRLDSLPLLVLYLTDGCNSRCQTCDIWRSPRRNMSPAVLEAVTSHIEALSLRWVLLSGGEALQHPHWGAIARTFKARGVFTMMLTNGLLVKKYAAELAESVDELIVSLDAASPALYAQIRGVDALPLLLEGLDAVRALGLTVATRTTLQAANYASLPDLIALGLAHDVNRLSFLTLDVSNPFAFGARTLSTQAGDGRLNAAQIAHYEALVDEVAARYAREFAAGRIAESSAKLRGYAAYFRALIGEGSAPTPRCNAPQTTVVVEVDGSLRPCYFLPAWGKLDGRPLGSVLNEAGALALRRAVRRGERRECAGCVCPLYKGMRQLAQL
jgi:MoaA/NifB/PqqE/SkfB family radical SAM enzyme